MTTRRRVMRGRRTNDREGGKYLARGAQQRAEQQQARRQKAKRQEGEVAFESHASDYKAGPGNCASAGPIVFVNPCDRAALQRSSNAS